MVEKKKSFLELRPGKKRLFALLGAAGVVIIFAAASEMLFSPASKDKAPKNDVQRNVLTDTNTRQLGIDGLSASVQRMRREITELSNCYIMKLNIIIVIWILIKNSLLLN